MSSRASNSNKLSKKATPKITGSEVAEFFANLKKGSLKETAEEKEEIRKLLEEKDEDPEILEDDDEEEEDEQVDSDEESNQTTTSAPAHSDVDDHDAEFFKLMDVDLEAAPEAESEDNRPPVTKELLTQWVKQLNSENPLPAVKRLILALHSASTDSVETPYFIPSKNIYKRIIILACKQLGKAFAKILSMKGKGYDRVPSSKTRKWKKTASTISVYLKSVTDILQDVSDPDLLDYILRDLQASVYLFGNLTKKVDGFLKCMLDFMGHERESIRFSAFLIVHRMATLYPFPFVSTCIKGVYFSLIEKSTTYVAQTHAVVEFLKNCVVELCGIDLAVSYKYAFVSLRELAIQLREAYETTKQAYLKCYNWTFLNCLHVWVRVLCTYQKQDELRDLVYPLVQIVIGCITVNTSIKYFNVRLKCVAMLHELMNNIKNPTIYIPVLPHLLAILNSDIGQRTFKKNTTENIDLDFKLRMLTSLSTTSMYQRHILESTLFYIIEFFAFNSRSIAFPELAFPAERFLRDYYQTSDISVEFKKKVKLLIKDLEKHSAFILEKRSKVNFSPLDIEQSRNFLNKEQEPQPTIMEKVYEFHKSIRDKEILGRIHARVGDDMQLENLDDDVESDPEEEAPVEKKVKQPVPDNKKKQIPEKKNIPAAAKKTEANDDKQKKKKSDKKSKKQPTDHKKSPAKKAGKRSREPSSEEPASKKRKTTTAKNSKDVVKELDLDNF
jgi:nucleolar complex protein 2